MIEATDETFEQEVVNSDIPVIVDFWAPWCGPCKMMTPIFEAVSPDFEGRVKFVKVNVDESTSVAQQFGVRGVPTFMVFKAGAVVTSLSGARPKQALLEFVNQNTQ